MFFLFDESSLQILDCICHFIQPCVFFIWASFCAYSFRFIHFTFVQIFVCGFLKLLELLHEVCDCSFRLHVLGLNWALTGEHFHRADGFCEGAYCFDFHIIWVLCCYLGMWTYFFCFYMWHRFIGLSCAQDMCSLPSVKLGKAWSGILRLRKIMRYGTMAPAEH